MKQVMAVCVAMGQLATAALAEAPWVSLFDGQTLAGWQVTGRPADVAKGFWRVADGAIEANSMGQKGMTTCGCSRSGNMATSSWS